MEERTLERVLALVKETRAMLLPHWGNVDAFSKTTSDGKTSVVTDLDRSVEKFLEYGLQEIDLGATFAGEEFGGSRQSGRFWLCDPIDGTMHFVRGMRGCTVMLALIEEGVVTCSIIYDFVDDVTFHASRGRGAFKNGKSARVSARPLAEAYIACQISLDKPENLEARKRLRTAAKLYNPNISGYEFSLIADGTLDGRVVLDDNAKDWDNAPGTLLVQEAGGIVANIGSTSYDFQNMHFIAANPIVYRALTEGPDAIFPSKA